MIYGIHEFEKTPVTDFTIGIDTIEKMVGKNAGNAVANL